MRYTINSDGIRRSENGEFASWAEARAAADRRRAEALAARIARMTPAERDSYERRLKMQQLVAAGVHVAPISVPNRRNDWNDEPPEDM